MVKRIGFIIALLFFPVLAGFPLLHQGLIPTHDGEYHVIRFYEFFKTLTAGYWYPRWAPDLNLGYGVPLFTYVYPLPNYLAALFHLVGFSFIDSFRLIMFFSLLFGAVFFYLFSREFFSKPGAFTASVLYVFTPYHFLDIYIRGSIGEVVALALFPGFLFCLTRLIKKEESFFVSLTAVFLALLVFSHNILALIFVSFSVFYTVFLFFIFKKGKKAFFSVCISYTLGILLSSLFFIPALFEKQYVVGLQIANPLDYFAQVYQLLFPSWGSGFSPSDPNFMSLQIGMVNLLIFFCCIPLLFLKRAKKVRSLLLFFMTSFLVSVYLTTSYSTFFWKTVPLMNYVEYPWRFLSLTLIYSSFLCGALVEILGNKIVPFLIIAGSVLLTVGYTKPAYYLMRQDTYYETRPNFILGTDSPGNAFNTMWWEGKPSIAPKEVATEGIVLSSRKTFFSETATVTVPKSKQVKVGIAYFPGWDLTVDRRKVSVASSKGIISFAVPAGKHTFSLSLGNTKLEDISTYVSLGSFIILVFLVFKSKYALLRKRK